MRAVDAVCAGDADFACIVVCAWFVLGSAVVLAFVLCLAVWNLVPAVCLLSNELLTGFLYKISKLFLTVCYGSESSFQLWVRPLASRVWSVAVVSFCGLVASPLLELIFLVFMSVNIIIRKKRGKLSN